MSGAPKIKEIVTDLFGKHNDHVSDDTLCIDEA
jgi:hypothetical protein